jgi:CheY-like chemotaxis protein
MKVAEDAMKAKQQFLSNMSHEIRTPMSAIIGFTKLVLKSELNPRQKEYLTAIKVSGEALIVLINDILDLAKVDAGKMTFEQTTFKMSTSIAAMLHLFEIRLQEKNLTLEKDYDDRIPEFLVGDPVRLRQIILNLISNAVKFTETGGITLRVRLLSETGESVVVEFTVGDTGIGIAEENLENIFESFQQASKGTARIYGGTGLGLAIVKKLVEAQHGRITVTSTPGKGSAFSFVLDFKKSSVYGLSEAYGVDSEIASKHIKVLVVEDMPLNQLLITTLLDEFGFESECASNGRIGLQMLAKNDDQKQRPFDIILMDLHMPVMDGFETTEYIRKVIGSSIPILALSADVTTVDVVKCRKAGMNDYITKPVDEKELYHKIISLSGKSTQGLQLSSTAYFYPSSFIDLQYLDRRTKSSPKLKTEIISLYLMQTPTLVKVMKDAFQEKDLGQLTAAVHKMIPSFSVMGMKTECESVARGVLELAQLDNGSEKLSNLILRLENICNRTCEDLKKELIKHEAATE